MPYGDKTADEIIALTDVAIQPLLDICEIIIIACNTATALAIETLRAKHPNIKFIGFEPAIKPAALATKTGRIMMLATPATLQSARYRKLKREFAADVKIFEPDCSAWAKKIENGEFSDTDLTPVIDLANREEIDEIVLGCTHYLALRETLQNALPDVEIQQPIDGVARRLETFMLNMRCAKHVVDARWDCTVTAN